MVSSIIVWLEEAFYLNSKIPLGAPLEIKIALPSTSKLSRVTKHVNYRITQGSARSGWPEKAQNTNRMILKSSRYFTLIKIPSLD